MEESWREAAGAGRRVHKEIIGYVIQSSFGLIVTPLAWSSLEIGGKWEKIRW